jgi:chaperone modulatory protein CbpM
METREFLLQARLEAAALEAWLDAGWLLPGREGETRQFSEIDVARAQLIHDLTDLGVNDDGIPVILDLVDQLHGLRRALRELLSRIDAQPEATRRRLAAGIGEASDRTGKPRRPFPHADDTP